MNRIYLGTRKGLFWAERGPGGWALAGHAFVGDPVSVVLFDPRTSELFAALDLGHFGAKLRRSRDGGATWDELAAPTFPTPTAEELEREKTAQSPSKWSVEKVWALEAGGPDQPGVLWAGTIPGGLFKSEDGGASWALVRSLWDMPERLQWFGGGADHPGLHSITVDPRDSRRVLVGVSCGGAWLTEDGGATWSVRSHGMLADFMPPERRGDPVIQDPHCIVRCASAPDVLWAQHHCGVFVSRDDGAKWDAVPAAAPSGFGFAVAVHPGDPNTAWFVPAVKDAVRVPVDARLVVSRTRDGGRTFEVLDDGLPPPPAYDLVYRHALDVDATGRLLAFGSTTGGAWVSEDGGDHFSAIAARLPPVYAVHIA